MKTNNSRPEHDVAALAALLPDLAEAELPPGRLPILRDHIMSEIWLDSAGRRTAEGAPRNRRTGRRNRAWVVLALSACAGILAAAVVVLTPPARHSQGDGPRASVSPGAARLLAKVAKVAGLQPAPSVRNGQFEYIRSEQAYASAVVILGNGKAPMASTGPAGEPGRIQTWTSVSDLCRKSMRRENGRTLVLPGVQGVRCPWRGSLNDPTYRLLESLPTRPRTLLRLIYEEEHGHGPSPQAEAFTTIGDLIEYSIAPPAVGAALYRAAALIPGVTVVRHAVDAAGRHGVAVAFSFRGKRSEWIFSRRTWQMIGERDVVVKTGEVVGSSAIISRGFVDRMGEVPSRQG